MSTRDQTVDVHLPLGCRTRVSGLCAGPLGAQTYSITAGRQATWDGQTRPARSSAEHTGKSWIA